MRNFLYRMREGLIRFMQGRYGSDKLNLVLILVSLALNIICMFFRRVPGLYITVSILAEVPLLLALFRTFSRNIPKRQAELRKYEQLMARIKGSKTHHIYKCPGCGQKIRVPRKNGVKVEIRCPKCGQTFVKKI